MSAPDAAFRKYCRLRHQLDKLSRRVARAAVEAFPVASEVHYQHGGNWRSGRVMWTDGNRVQIATPTGKEVFIAVDRLQP